MAIKVHDLKPAEGSTKNKQRKGRGIGGKGGKTAGRGTKGQHSRGRGKVRVGFEGGQMPLAKRVPKLRGFTNPFRVEYQPINLDTIAETGLTEVTPETLLEQGLVGKNALVKILGRGELKAGLTVKAHAFSKSAEEAITAAGGTIEVLPKPWGDAPRPPAKGNQHTNR
jgi:large subunit ribosomal protein L15